MTIAPIAAAWLLIWYISCPVRRSSWKVSDSRWQWLEQVAAQVEDHALLELRVDPLGRRR